MQKPEKPENLLPNGFGGEKENFSEAKIQTGYQKDVPDILGGANLNYLLDSLGKNLEYNNKISDFICNLPIGKYITTNANNELDYINTSISPATTDKLGGVKPDGTTITVTEDGTISGSVKVEVASSDKAGIMKTAHFTLLNGIYSTLYKKIIN